MLLLAFRSFCLGLVLFSQVRLAGIQSTPNAPQQSPAAVAPADGTRLRDQAQQEAGDGKTAAAIRDYRQALAQQPGWVEGWWNLGMLFYSINEFQDAESPFSRVTVLAPGFGNGWALLGLSEFETKNYDDARTHLERAQALGIRDDEEIARVSAYHLALLRTRAGEFDRAADLLKSTFGTGGGAPQQAKIALGLATLRVPLLPQEVDPSREALLEQAGDAAIDDDLQSFAAIAHDHPDIPYLHLAWCRALAQAARNRDALKQCLAETVISPKSPLAWVEVSRLQRLNGEKTAALRSARAALRIDPANIEARQALVDIERPAGKDIPTAAPPSSDISASTGEPPEQRIIQLYGTPAVKSTQAGDAGQALWKQALREYMAADYAHARADLADWLASNPPTGTAWALLGLCEFELHDNASALIHLDRGARLGLNASSQSLDQARYTYGILLVRAARFDEADTVLARVSDQTGPLRAKVAFALGLSLLRRAELPQDVSAADADLVASAGNIAGLLERSQYDKAFPQFQELLRRYPQAPFLHYAYGTALMALSEFDQATEQMKAERRISPRSELPCLRLASIALRQNDPAPAVRWSQCALDLAPDSVDAHYLLGRASMDANDLTTAIKQLEIAETLSPESPEIHFNLARAYAKAKLPEKAAEERDIFTRLNTVKKPAIGSQP